MNDVEVPVLIVGGSLVGMSTAALLAHHGIAALAVEYHRGTAIHPRAAQTSQRTMEIFRSLGLDALVRQRSEEQFVQDGAILAVETLAGGVTEHFIANLNAGVRDVSPVTRVFLTQKLLEPLLRARAEETGAQLRFGTEMVSFEQDAQGVSAVIRDRDSGETAGVRAQYVVAADGAHSRVRQALGLRMLGHGTFSNSATIYFHANLRPFLADKQWAVVYVNHPRLRGFFRFEKPFDSGFLAVNTLGDPADPVTDVSAGLDERRALELVHMALGTDIPVTIDSVMQWNAAADVAEHFNSGRVFLAGDAAHIMPPNGGFGGNTGIQDAHNLAWKLALVLQGKALPALLATYEAERRPAATLTVEQAYTRYVTRTAPSMGTAGMQPLVPDLNIEMGYVYRSPAIVAEDRAEDRGHDDPRQSRARPGTRAPHIWLERNGERISTLDLAGRNFALVGGPQAGDWCDSAPAAGTRAGVDIDVHRIGAGGLSDPASALCAGFGIEPSGCVLLRPDGFVAWRARNGAGASSQRLGAVLSAVLAG